jgi:VanZ family protein
VNITLGKKENNLIQKVRVQFVLLLLLVGAPLFFLGGPGYHGSRSFAALWNLGHVLFFFLTSWLICKVLRNRFLVRSVPAVQVYVFLLVLVFGIAVEGLQMCFDGRSPDVHDILRNQLGCLIALAFFDSGKRKLRRGLLTSFQVTVVILVGAVMYPLSRAVTDELIALSQFPLLSDFETVFEEDRWKGDKLLNVVEGLARNGRHSLKVQLTTDTYSGVSLFYFPGNWEGFENLYISVFLPEEGQLELVSRVHDSEHNNEYTDRFNRSFVLETGWNDLVISLVDIQNGPVDRLLNMNKIENLGFFVMGQEKERIIYIDHIYLGR